MAIGYGPVGTFWYDPPPPPATAGPVDRGADLLPAGDLARSYIATFLDNPMDIEVRVADGQYNLYDHAFSPTLYLEQIVRPGAVTMATDVPNPPRPSEVLAQQEAELSAIQDWLPGAP